MTGTSLFSKTFLLKVIRIGFPGRETVKDILDAVIDYEETCTAEVRQEMRNISAFHMRLYNMMDALVRYIGYKSKATLEMEKKQNANKSSREKAKKKKEGTSAEKEEVQPTQQGVNGKETKREDAPKENTQATVDDKSHVQEIAKNGHNGVEDEKRKRERDDTEKKDGTKNVADTQELQESKQVAQDSVEEKQESGSGNTKRGRNQVDQVGTPNDPVEAAKIKDEEKRSAEVIAEDRKRDNDTKKKGTAAAANMRKLKTATNVIVKTKSKGNGCSIS